jgi:hypothetical protein
MVKQVNKSIIGNMDSNDAYLFKANVWMRSLMLFRNWMPRAIRERYGSLRYNRELGRIEKGRYSTFFDMLKLNKDVSLLKSDIQHQEKHRDNSDTECPKCSHVWKIGYDSGVYTRLIETRNRTNEHIDSLNRDRRVISEQLEVIIEQVNIRKDFNALFNGYPELTPLLTDIQEALYENPSSIATLIHKFKIDLLSLVDINNIKSKINDIKKELTKKADYDAVIVSNMKSNVVTLENKYSQYSVSYNKLLQEKRDNEFILQQRSVLEKINKELSTFVTEVNNFKRAVGANIFHKYINSAIVHLKTEISVAQEALTNNNLRQRTVSMLEDDIKLIETKTELLNKSCDVLSPTSGLIAQGLNRFLNSFVSDMNHFISLIWSYPLELLCEQYQDEDIDLDFKFKVVANDNDPVDDVSCTSSGQKEVIDLAFRKINTSYLGLVNHPLYLDEFGVKMDHAHRNRAVRVIEDMILESSQMQVFMVSHYSSSYSSLSNAQVVILHPNNVIVPAEMKQSDDVQISYYER